MAQGDAFAPITDNPFLPVAENLLSTFSIDVDTASYANVRRYLNQNTQPAPRRGADRGDGQLLPLRTIRPPEGDAPVRGQREVARCPWDAGHRLVRIGLKGREIDSTRAAPEQPGLPDRRLGLDEVDTDKLPLLKAGP